MKKLLLPFNDTKYSIYYYEDIVSFVKLLKQRPSKIWGLDIETAKAHSDTRAGLDPYLSKIRLIQLYDGDGNIFVLDCLNLAYPDFKDLRLWTTDKKFIAHNAIFEITHLELLDFKDMDITCSMILGIMCDRAERSPYDGDETVSYKGFSLQALAKKYLSLDISKTLQVSDWNSPVLTDAQISYAAIDTIVCYDLALKLFKKIKKYNMLKSYKLFKRMLHVISEMQLNGMEVDKNKHTYLIQRWKEAESTAYLKCCKYFKDINLNSPKQLATWLANNPRFKNILSAWPKTPSGSYTFNRSEISDFIRIPEIAALMHYKQYSKLLSTYGEGLTRHLNPVTGRYHTQFNLAQVRTGRLSSSKPNLQNMPRDNAVRSMFCLNPANKCKYIVADFSQIEMRVAGALSKDSYMLKAYTNGDDLHTLMAAAITHKHPSAVTKKERQLAKAVNFGFLYGMGAKKFITYVKTSYPDPITEEEAYRIRGIFYETYAEYIAWSNQQRIKAEKLGFTRTPLGRLRKLASDEIYTKAVNTPVQGGAAEVLFISMIRLRNNIKRLGYKAKLASCIHDEVIVECKDWDVDAVTKLVEESMVFGMLKLFPDAPVNGLVEAHSALSWADAKL